MTIYSPGTVVLISFPFTAFSASKRRPAVIINRPEYQNGTHDVILAAVTSQPHEGLGDIALNRWSDAGLLKPSWMRAGKLVTIHESLIERTLGQLSSDDGDRARAALTSVLAE
jgi:mRNA interferase MazF